MTLLTNLLRFEMGGTFVKAADYTPSTSSDDIAASNISTGYVAVSDVPTADAVFIVTVTADVVSNNAAVAGVVPSNIATAPEVNSNVLSDCPVDNLSSVSESPDYFYALVVG